jgi:hypothetical protein
MSGDGVGVEKNAQQPADKKAENDVNRSVEKQMPGFYKWMDEKGYQCLSSIWSHINIIPVNQKSSL